MKKLNHASFLSFLTLLMMIFLITFSGCTEKNDRLQDDTLTVISENNCWSPVMSSIVGIDMTPEYEREGEYLFHWTAEGPGSPDVMFLLWGEDTDFKVTELGNDTWTQEGETVWWSFQGSDVKGMPERFLVKVRAVDKDTNEAVSEREISIKRKVTVFCIDSY